MKKIIFLGLAFISLALGAIGAFLPILPTVPFLLLASFFFAKGSKKYHDWFVGTKLYQKHLKEFAESRSLPLKTKLCICIPVTAVLLVPIILYDILAMRIALIVLILLKHYYFWFRIKNTPNPKKAAKKEQTQAPSTNNTEHNL